MDLPPMDTLHVPFRPPVLFFLALMVGAGLDHFWPWALLPFGLPLRLGLGGFLLLEALILGAWSLLTLRRLQTSPEFGKAVTALAQIGPYRFSRNPLYVALVLLLAGFATALNSGWIGVNVLLLILSLDRLVIAWEERYLRVRFGSEYETYLARARRWV